VFERPLLYPFGQLQKLFRQLLGALFEVLLRADGALTMLHQPAQQIDEGRTGP
jgi:hypothetical protein